MLGIIEMIITDIFAIKNTNYNCNFSLYGLLQYIQRNMIQINIFDQKIMYHPSHVFKVNSSYKKTLTRIYHRVQQL